MTDSKLKSPHWLEEGEEKELGRAVSDPRHKGDPVRKFSNGYWYFYDEVWAALHGPYVSQSDCDTACTNYAQTL